jgi:hypothetical protein
MKQFIIGLIVLASIGISQANTIVTNTPLTNTGLSVPTAIKKESGRAKLPRIAKPKIFRSNPHRGVYYAINANDTDDIGIDDDDKITSYRKRDFGKVKTEPTDDDPEGIITEEIRWKLFLARTAAMIRYQQIHS